MKVIRVTELAATRGSDLIGEDLRSRVLNEMPDEERLYDLAELFKVFGDTTRIRILYVLFEAEMCVCDIADILNMTQSAISHQLRVLKQARLVRNRRVGKQIYYSLADEVRNAPIAHALNAALVLTMGTVDRGIKTRSYPDQPRVNYYSVLRHTAAYGCPTAFLIEHGFHTNPEDAAFLSKDQCLRRLAEAEAEVIDKLF